jgi:tRNA(Ile)-lysidine synthase
MTGEPSLLDRVAAGGLLAPGSRVVVLLSGGRDSVCLADLAATICGVGGVQSVRALHVNYGLREAAGADEAACRALCERLGIELEVVTAAVPATDAGNLQAWARDLRYGEGARLAAAHGARLAAGHTATDQVETVLYRLAASPGRRALLGMPDERGRLVRPLLRAGATREETAAWCRGRGLTWSEDASNTDASFARARVRGAVVPAMREVHPAAEANVLRTAELLNDEAQVLDTVVDTALAGRDRIALEHLAGLPPALGRLVVRRLAEAATGGFCAGAPRRLADILALGRDGTAAIDVGEGARAVVELGVLRFERTPPLPRERLPSGRP